MPAFEILKPQPVVLSGRASPQAKENIDKYPGDLRVRFQVPQFDNVLRSTKTKDVPNMQPASEAKYYIPVALGLGVAIAILLTNIYSGISLSNGGNSGDVHQAPFLIWFAPVLIGLYLGIVLRRLALTEPSGPQVPSPLVGANRN